jgi:hypothetical protein
MACISSWPRFKAQGWNDSPFNIYPAKGRYMWRDMERICDSLSIHSGGLLYFREMVFSRRELRRDSRALRGFQISCVLSIASILQTIWILATLP